MFQATVSPIFRSTLTVHTAFWNNAPTLLPTVHRLYCRPVGIRVGSLFQKAVYTVKVLLMMGETVARNM